MTFTTSHTLESDVRAADLWALYEDVATWPSWDADAEHVTREGPLATGTAGTLKFRGQPELRYVLRGVEHERAFTDEVRVGNVVVRVEHRLDPLPAGRLRLTYTATVDGPGADAVGAAVSGDFPDTMAALVAAARERSS